MKANCHKLKSSVGPAIENETSKGFPFFFEEKAGNWTPPLVKNQTISLFCFKASPSLPFNSGVSENKFSFYYLEIYILTNHQFHKIK